jgi:hypothetical protein
MAYVTLQLFNDERLQCGGCERVMSGELAYLTNARLNHPATVYVRCERCYGSGELANMLASLLGQK